MFDDTILEKIKSKDYKEYFNLFGEKVGINLLCQKSTTVNQMVLEGQVKLMYYWYKKTGYKFIPDYVVMKSFPYQEIDNFLINAKYWSKLMKIKEFSEVYEGRVALLKLAYVYGVFNNDNDSLNNLEFLLKGIPKKISKEDYNLLIQSENRLQDANKYNLIFPYKSEVEGYYSLKKCLEDEKIITKDTKYIFEELYKSIDNKMYSLNFNYQLYPNIISKLRTFMETWGLETILDPFRAYQIFSKLEMKYDPYFKKFLIDNIDIILANYEYSVYIPKIQKEFQNIMKINSNRKLTFDLALNYVKEDNYENVLVGNEKLSSLISKVGIYSQEEFEIIQKIYNYGKIRTFSTIPRIEKNLSKYSYEILKLDDPLTLVIGTLTDCCQKLNDKAEVCMEHSMVDVNGRLFVVRDSLGQIIAQSWIWRNKNVICFDNIEIPSKVLADCEKIKGPVARYQLATEIYEVYKKASYELLQIDNLTYLNLLKNNLITKEQYDNLKLSKVTVGLGYNDIASIIKRNAKSDSLVVTRPHTFNPLVKLKFNLYLNDSSSQYILAKTNETTQNNYQGFALSLYNDDYTIYTDSNITKEDLLILENLRLLTDNCNDRLIEDSSCYNKIFSVISEKYNSKIDSTKIIIHPNFSIIYEEKDNCNKLLDIFLNTKINNNKQQLDIENITLTQIKLALLQMSKNNKKIDITKLPLSKIAIYNKLEIRENIEETKTKILKKVLVK